MTTRSAFVSTGWLAEHLSDPTLRILDATYFLPGVPRNAEAEFLERHIPGAQFFDIDGHKDFESDLPHMLPDPDSFAEAMTDMGIGNDCTVVCYDSHGLMSAARPWWMFRTFGHDKVFVLDGGLKKWLAEGRPTESGPVTPPTGRFHARFRPELVSDRDAVLTALDMPAVQIIDARSAGRFAATEPEPRAGLAGGHMPGARNVPSGTLVNPDTGEILSKTDLTARFIAAGVDLKRPIITSCGSGVTACLLAIGLYELGRADVSVYDGSWSEWGSYPGLPIATGDAA
ncbi:sulfurtransferase [Elstera cyanobacteriorum]|uniref:Sulfurtransferase n=1 Tax=Elstera cyanobacteriorum TaxID=2022747 RepID=A0A255XP30_9PROT|nr:3-mercaptopyruvate sulfurtransferase [Elstera cyanobacteriorum]OYQ18641.1 3-mercaptopyruvate sulfurtransferase [Elstera cyanobacteriorum]GFZ78861.1 sulfurtransferase [Elstera cyanobacteriorum]